MKAHLLGVCVRGIHPSAPLSAQRIRPLLCALFAGLSGCTAAHQRPTHLDTGWISVTFERPRTLQALSHLITETDSEQTVANVVALGGEILDFEDDMLLIRPHYLILRLGSERSNDLVVRRGWNDSKWPPNVLVDLSQRGVRLDRYRVPNSDAKRITDVIPFLLLVYFVVRYVTKPRW